MMSSTLAHKLYDAHLIGTADPSRELLYIDLHLIHEVTTPQAFEGLRLANRPVRRPDLVLATMDHNVPTTTGAPEDRLAVRQMSLLEQNCRDHGITLYEMGHERQGIVHIIGPELGISQPGMTIVCGDSHTSTHGAFGALAFGIGTSEVEHVLATQTLPQRRPNARLVRFTGALSRGVSAKDLMLALLAKIGIQWGIRSVIEFQGSAVDAMSMEERMTLCNMSIEAGARTGLVAPDATTIGYLRGRPFAPEGARWDEAVEYWSTLSSDPDATFDAMDSLDAGHVEPIVTWGTTPAMSAPVSGRVPSAADADYPEQVQRALRYMGLEGGESIEGMAIDRVFIGSCTNARLEDLRAAAAIVSERKVAPGVRAMVVPGSAAVRAQAQREGLADRFIAAGFEWRTAGCSMCVAMNDDRLEPGERCASTSNRNFEGRQGLGGRTHLMSPAMAAAAAITGSVTDVRNLLP